MLTRHFPFGRIPQLSLVALCSLAAGWSAGRHIQFVSLSREELADYSPPYALVQLDKQPAHSRLESRLQPDSATDVRPDLGPPANAAASDPAPQQQHDLTGFS